MNKFITSIAAMALAFGAQAAPFQNGSFELGGTPCNTFNVPAGNTVITGWTVSVGNIDWLGVATSCGWQASSGSNSLDLVGTGGVGGIRQTFDTVPGTTYQVLFDLAGNSGAPPVVKPLAVTVNGVTTNFTFDTTGRSATNMGWTTQSLTFTATSTSTTIDFVSDVRPSGGTLNAGAALDNVRIAVAGAAPGTAPIPLDYAHLLAMLAIALSAAWMMRRRGAARG